jgi:HSP20 family protein
MSRDDLSIFMWSEACRLLDRAENLHRRFFRVGSEPVVSWEPPADVFETERELLIEIALPGVEPGAVEVAFESVIRRMELPHGRFERRIRLDPGRYELAKKALAEGCLRLVLLKLD